MQLSRRLVGAVVAACATLAAISLGAPAMAQSAASVAVTPNQGAPGKPFDIYWSGFSDCSGTAVFTWDGQFLVDSGSRLIAGKVSTSVPSGAAPGGHAIVGGCRGRTFAPSTVFTVVVPTTTTTPRPTTTTPPRTTRPTTPPVTTTTTPTTTTTTTTTSTTPAPSTTTPTATGLTFDHEVVGAGDSLAASGQGCPPGSPVELRSDGQVIGHATADPDGAFQAPLEFTTFAAGRREVVADCGVELTGAVEQVVSSSTGGSANGATLALLVFFVLAGIGLVRMRAGR